MSMMVSFVLSFFPRDVLDEILNLIESVSEDFPSYSTIWRAKVFSSVATDFGPSTIRKVWLGLPSLHEHSCLPWT